MNPILFMQYMALAFELVQKGSMTVNTIRLMLKAGGASDEQIAAIDARYDEAIARRERDG